ncbi:heavy metal sensor histidine kinase [Pseudomonas sp. PS1]|uniref:Sensor protein n=1 Tax=Stutzerimonas marianensis TaxID=2929513 RepID=A0A9X1W711_9GAMM|nr:heavy metal sensor histidine kinase [Pseudomonas marianensis]MCJ0975495.1 heavy metal sensor histidine kinase [Pseudomonas marianensis]
MKPLSLASRLALQITLTGAALVALLIGMSYWVLVSQLESRAEEEVTDKLAQIDHGLAEDTEARMGRSWQHALSDTVLGHDNLSITVIGDTEKSPIFSIGRFANAPEQLGLVNRDGEYLGWTTRNGVQMLTGRKQIQVPGLGPMTLLLSQDRSADQRLVAAFLRSALVTVPMLLILIGLAGWLVANNGLRPLRKFRALATKVSTQDLSPRIRSDQLPLELQELAHSLNVMLHRLDDGVQQLSQFSDDVAHELKTPLNNLIGKAQVTLVRERSKEQYREVLESSVEELERMDRIVSDMLFLAQASQATPTLQLERLSLGSEARRVCDYFEVLAEEAGVATTVTGDGMVLGNRLMVQRAISNLLSNALRHSTIGSTVELEILDGEAEVITMTVTNQGSTIETDHIPHLFDRFYRVGGMQPRGAGLGLAIVRSVMALHNGNVTVASKEGRTTFELTFPRHG